MKPMKMLRQTAWAQALTLTALLPGLVFLPTTSWSNPSGATITHGDVEIDLTNPAHLMILQSSDKAIINWEDFSIAPGEITQFVQPGAGSTALNRVTGGNVSALMGTLQANGGVILVNPNGILVGAGGVVDIGGLTVLSTLDIDDADFLDGGDMRFYGNSAAGVTNLGTITSRGGDVVLLGNFVDNAGAVGAPDGTVAFGAGGEFIVDTIGDSRISVVSGGPGGEKGVTNSGTVTANSVEFKAHGNVYALAIQNTGIVRANAVNRSGGRITLSAAGDGTVGGRIENTGTLQARGLGGAGGEIFIDAGVGGVIDNVDGTIDADGEGSADGGTITMLGDIINIIGNSKVSADGGNGGTIQIGSPESTSSITVGGDSAVSANGSAGSGGTVLIQGTPSSLINIDGAVSANGTSSGGVIGIEGGTVNTGANSTITANGSSGGVVTINGAETVNTNGAIEATSSGSGGGSVLVNGFMVNTGADSVIDTSGVLDGGNVTVSSNGVTNLSGEVDASASGGEGGRVDVTGAVVNVGNDTAINASGALGGGEVNIGGGFKGQDDSVRNSVSTVVGEGVSIDVDSRLAGDAGRAVIWSDGSTFFSGAISARARGIIGNGGLVEVSGRRDLRYRGSVDTRAANGVNGTLLLDPTDVIIGPGATATLTDVALVEAILQNNVVIHTSGTGTADGDITILGGSDIQYDSPNSLAFFAHNNIRVSGDIKNHGTTDAAGTGNITLVAGWDGTGDGTFGFDPDGPTLPGSGDPAITAADVLAGTYGSYGNNNGSIFINDAATEPVEVGSARGETNAFGENVFVTSGDSNGEFSQIGYRRENDMRAYALKGLGADGVIGGGDDEYTRTAIDLNFDNGVTGNINVHANGTVLLLQNGNASSDDGVKNNDRTYVMIGHGGIKENDNDIDNRGTQTNDALAQSGGVPGNAGGIDYGSDSGNVTVGNGDNHGDITVMAGTLVYLQAGRAEAHAQIGHGGLANDDPDANRSQIASDTSRNNGGTVQDNNFRNRDIFGNMTGDITVISGRVELEGGRYNDAPVQIGHGGTRVRGQHEGNIVVEATLGDVNVRAAPDSASGGPTNSNDWRWLNNRDQSNAQIGHGGFDGRFVFFNTLGEAGAYGGAAGNGNDAYDTSGNTPLAASDGTGFHLDALPRRTVLLNTRAGAGDSVGNSSFAGEGIAINPLTGESYGHRGDITITAAKNVTFMAANGTDAYAMAGHGGRSTHGDHRGDISVTAIDGDITFSREAWQVNERGRDITNRGHRAHVQIGHGGTRYQGGATGNISVDASGDVRFDGGRSEAYAMVGHGGRGEDGSTWNDGRQRNAHANGTHSGDINVNAGGDVRFRSGFTDVQAHSKIGHGGYFQPADVVGAQTVGSAVVAIDDGAQTAQDEGHNGEITVTSGGEISFKAGQDDLLTGQTYQEMNGGDNFTQLGHGGRYTKGDHHGAINLTAVDDVIFEARGGWDSVTVENNAGDGNTNRVGTPRLNSTEDNGRTGYRNFALLGHGGHDSEHINTNATDNWNNSGKNGDGIGVHSDSTITVNAGGDIIVQAAQKDTTTDKPMPIRILDVNQLNGLSGGRPNIGNVPQTYTTAYASFGGPLLVGGNPQNFFIEQIGSGTADITNAGAFTITTDGTSTLQALVDAWNTTGDPTVTVAIRTGTGLTAGTAIPDTGQTITLTQNGQLVTPGAGFSRYNGRIATQRRADGEYWEFPDAVLSAEDSFAQIGNGGRATDYQGSGGAANGGGQSINPIDGLGHRGDIILNAGGSVLVEASDIKQAVAGENVTDGVGGQVIGINVLEKYTGAGAIGDRVTTGTPGGTGTHFVGPGIGQNNQANTATSRYINGDNSQNDPTQGTRNYAQVGLGGHTARGDHNGAITINAGGNLDVIAGEGREAAAYIGSGGFDSDRVNNDGQRRDDTGQTTDIDITIGGKLTLMGGGLQNGDTSGLTAAYDAGTNTMTVFRDDNLIRSSYAQIGSGGMYSGGSHHADINILAGTDTTGTFVGGVDIMAGNNHRGAYGMIGSGGSWGRSQDITGNISVVTLTGDINLKGGVPTEDTLDDPLAGPANPGNIQTARESYAKIGNGGFDTDAQGGNQNNGIGSGGYSGTIEVVASEGTIRLEGGGSEFFNLDNDNFRNLSAQIGHGGPYSDGDSVGDIRVAAGTNLEITGGKGARRAYAQIGHGGNNVAGDQEGAIDIDVGVDLIMEKGIRVDANGLNVRDAYAKIGHSSQIFQGNANNGSGAREGEITVSVGNDLITRDGTNADGSDSGFGPTIGHIDPKNTTANPAVLAPGDTLIAVSRVDPVTGTGIFDLSPGTVFTSADAGFTSQLRLYMPTPAQNMINTGAYLNNQGYVTPPLPGDNRDDELVATEHTFTTGVYDEPVGDFGSPPEGAWQPSGFGFYNVYYADDTFVPPVDPPVVGPVLPPAIEEEIILIPVVEDLFNVLPFLFVDKYDSYDRFGFGPGFLGGALYSIFGLTANEENEASKPKPPRVPGDEILEKPDGLFGLAAAQTDEEKAQEEEKSGRYLPMPNYPHNTFYATPLDDPTDYNSYNLFGNPIGNGTP